MGGRGSPPKEKSTRRQMYPPRRPHARPLNSTAMGATRLRFEVVEA